MDCDTWPIPLIDLSTPTDFCVNGCVIPADTDLDLLESASIQAGIILRTLSGNRVGTCTDTIRPLSECGVCRGVCRCGSGDRIRVLSASGPVIDVTEVTIDGVPVTGWRFYPSGQLLYRVPPDVWPSTDVKWADCGDPDTMCVEVVIGSVPDAWAIAVHDELTCELLKSCTGEACRLPKNATSVTGQGVTVTLSDTQINQLIPSVAAWVAAINPAKATQPTKVFSPDMTNCGGSAGSGGSSSGSNIIDGGGP
jgi:hypothetical protein